MTSVAPIRLAMEDPAPPVSSSVPEPASRTLLERLAAVLDQRGVQYCQWKGHWSSHRWATGYGDVDLLVSRNSHQLFRTVVGEMGFKPVQSPAHQTIPGVESYFGYDPGVPRLLHLHVHYRLVLGDYWKPVYRLPLEQEILSASVRGPIFRVPAPTHQFLLFVLRLMLRQVGRPHLSVLTRWTSGVQIQLESLEACSDREQLRSLLASHLPTVDLDFFDRCVRSLREERGGALERAVLPWELHQRLRSHARHPSLGALLVAAAEKLFPAQVQSLPGTRARPASGGTVVALVGGDGAGKSTCARELTAWLAPSFPTTHAHLGNPPRSLTTLLIGGALKLQRGLERALYRSPRPDSLLELARHLCLARDRFRLYVRVQRFAAAGGIAICERYPIEQNRQLAGPRIPEALSGPGGPVTEWLRAAEAACYRNMLAPDAVFVLRLDPELAVQRKPEEPADYVRSRGQIIWETDWSGTGAHLIDASRPLTDVLQRIKEIIWSIL